MSNNPERILVIIPGLNVCGGMESFIMNYFRNIDRTKYIFDFITHDISNKSYCEEVEMLGGIIYKLPPFSIKNFKIIKNEFIKIIDQNHYRIVHCNMANAAFLYLKIAKQKKVPIRILHSHQNKAADVLSHAIRNIPLIMYGKTFANVRFACSHEAGKYLFGRKQYYLIENAIDYKQYIYNEEIREKVRNQLGFHHHFVIGHTGRLTTQKNQEFLIKVFKQLYDLHPELNPLLVLVGEGEDESKLKALINDLHLEDYVLLLGSRDDVNQLLQAFDVFVFPSLYEGLGISVLEAQATSLPCICSTEVPLEANVSHSIIYMSLSDPVEQWANKIYDLKDYQRRHVYLDDRYDITKKGKDYTALLDDILKERNLI